MTQPKPHGKIIDMRVQVRCHGDVSPQLARNVIEKRLQNQAGALFKHGEQHDKTMVIDWQSVKVRRRY